MNGTRLVAVATGSSPRADAVHGLLEQIAERGWLDGAGDRIVVQVGAAGRSVQAVETAAALAAALADRAPLLRVDVLDPGGEPATKSTAEESVEVQGRSGTGIRVPRAWFEPFFLVTVAAVHPDRRWRIGAALRVQAEVLARLNPDLSAAVLLAEGRRLGGADLAIVCGTHPTAGEWWAASPDEIQVEGAMARAAGLAPESLPAIRVIARHESLEPWDTSVDLPEALDVAGSATRAALGATRERAAAAARRVVDDAGRISRTLRKMPQVVRRRLAARRNSA